MARAVLVFRDRAVEKERLESEAAEQRARQRAGRRRRRRRSSAETAEEQTQVVRALNAGLGKLSDGDLTFRLTEASPTPTRKSRTTSISR